MSPQGSEDKGHLVEAFTEPLTGLRLVPSPFLFPAEPKNSGTLNVPAG